MKNLVGKLLGRSGSQPEVVPIASPAEPQTAAEIQAFDNKLTKHPGPPYYPLDQVLKNKSRREIEGPKSEPAPQSSLPESSLRYTDEKPIGEGGTAVVYRATDSRLKRPVALKRFKGDSNSSNDSDYLAELESASRVRHPNVVSTLDANIDAKGRFIVMELIDGIDAEVALSDGKPPFDINTFINFAIQTLEGLHATHLGGLLHLDIKPSNIMISEQVSGRGIVKIVDFGRAQLIEDDSGKPPLGRGVDGSIYYSAPEQLLNEELDIRTDLYALGCVFYWTLTCKRPFDGENSIQVMAAHIQHMVRSLREVEPTLPKWLSEWVMSLIAFEKSARPSSVQDVIDSLLDGERDQKVRRIDA